MSKETALWVYVILPIVVFFLFIATGDKWRERSVFHRSARTIVVTLFVVVVIAGIGVAIFSGSDLCRSYGRGLESGDC